MRIGGQAGTNDTVGKGCMHMKVAQDADGVPLLLEAVDRHTSDIHIKNE